MTDNENRPTTAVGAVTDLAGKAIAGLASNPSCLASVLLAGTMAILTYMSLQAERENKHDEFIMALRACPAMHAMPPDNVRP